MVNKTLIVVCAAALTSAASAGTWSVVASFDGPYEYYAWGIEAYGDYLYCAMWDDFITVITTTGSVVGTIPLADHAYDLDFDGTYFWGVDNYGGRRYTSAGSLLNSFPISFSAFGIVYDGSYIWLSDQMPSPNGRIYRMNTLGSIYSSFPCPGGAGGGLDRDGPYLWSDKTYDTNSGAWLITTTGSILDSLDAPDNTQSFGVAWNAPYLWLSSISPEASGWIYKMYNVTAVAPASLGRVKAIYR